MPSFRFEATDVSPARARLADLIARPASHDGRGLTYAHCAFAGRSDDDGAPTFMSGVPDVVAAVRREHAWLSGHVREAGAPIDCHFAVEDDAIEFGLNVEGLSALGRTPFAYKTDVLDRLVLPCLAPLTGPVRVTAIAWDDHEWLVADAIAPADLPALVHALEWLAIER